MYITCQKCKTSFVVSPEQIGSQGRRVRCSKCQHTWYVDPVDAPQADKAVTPEVELFKAPVSGVHLPIILPREPQKPSSDRIILMALFLIFGFVIFFSKSLDFGFVKNFSHNFTINDVKVYHIKSKDEMILNYKITNDSDLAATMPGLRIKLFDGQHNFVGAYDIADFDAELEPHQHMKFRTEFQDIPKDAETAEVEIGNQLDFIFR